MKTNHTDTQRKREIQTEEKTYNCFMTSTGQWLREARGGDAWINGWMKDRGEKRRRGQSGKLQKALVAFIQQFVFAAL